MLATHSNVGSSNSQGVSIPVRARARARLVWMLIWLELPLDVARRRGAEELDTRILERARRREHGLAAPGQQHGIGRLAGIGQRLARLHLEQAHGDADLALALAGGDRGGGAPGGICAG